MKLARLLLAILLVAVAIFMIVQVTVPSIINAQSPSFIFGTTIIPIILVVVAWQYGIKKLH